MIMQPNERLNEWQKSNRTRTWKRREEKKKNNESNSNAWKKRDESEVQ